MVAQSSEEKQNTYFMSTVSLLQVLKVSNMTEQIRCYIYALNFLYSTTTLVSWTHSKHGLFALLDYSWALSPSLAQLIGGLMYFSAEICLKHCLYSKAAFFIIFSNEAKVGFIIINDVKTSQSEKPSSPSCATSIICLSSDVMSSIMALQQKMKPHEKLDEAHTIGVNSWPGYWLSWWCFFSGFPQSLPQFRWWLLPSTLFPIH